MKSIIVLALCLSGLAASAQTACQVSSETIDRIDMIKEAGGMVKLMMVTIKSLIEDDECASHYLQPGDASALARKIMNEKSMSSSLMLNEFVSEAQGSKSKSESMTCQPSLETLISVNDLRSSSMGTKSAYVSMKGVLSSDNCLASSLNDSEMNTLAQRLIFTSPAVESTEAIMSQALSSK